VSTPIGFRVVAGVRVFDGDARLVGRSLCARIELQIGAACGTRAVSLRTFAARDIEESGASALVGMRDRATVWQAVQRHRTDRTIDATRAGRGGDDQATLLRIEGIGNLRQHAMRLVRARQACVGVVLAPRHARDVLHRAVQVGDTPPIRVQRASTQFGRGRMVGIGHRRRDRIQQGVATQTAGQQVIAFAMRADAWRSERIG